MFDMPGCLAPDARGGVRFLDTTARIRLQSAVEAAGWLLAAPRRLDAGARGQLQDRLEEAIESSLERRGAPGSGLGASADADMVLSDQLYRARQIGANGVVLTLDSLCALVGQTGILCDDDSAVLRFYAEASRRRPIALWLSPADTAIPGYAAPLPLRLLLGTGGAEVYESDDHVDVVAELASAVDHLRSRETSESRPPETSSWRSLVRAMEDAQGPKPLAAIEKLFVEAFIPLSDAVARGEGDDAARQCLQRFRTSFERSYTDAFAAAKVTRRRPAMVMDVPQIGSRCARLHGARTTALLLVDGMRYDLGLRVQKILTTELAGRAVLAEQLVLWAGLPSTTPMQLRLLARGPQGLGEVLDEPEMRERDMVVPRGRTAAVMRRMRLAGREMHKLDVIPSHLVEGGPAEAVRLDTIAEAVASPIVRYVSGLETRTLLMVFGDHGFLLPTLESGTGPGIEGGASPEQVLVPAQAWLVGGVH